MKIVDSSYATYSETNKISLQIEETKVYIVCSQVGHPNVRKLGLPSAKRNYLNESFHNQIFGSNQRKFMILE